MFQLQIQDKKFKEDAIWMLRAVRCSAKFDIVLHDETLRAISMNKKLLGKIKKERVRDELSKLLLGTKPSMALKNLSITGLLKEIIPELVPTIGFEQRTPSHDKTVFDHIIAVLDNVEPILELRLAALLHDVAKPNCFKLENNIGTFPNHNIVGAHMAEKILKRLKYDSRVIKVVSTLIEEHMSIYTDNIELETKRMMDRVDRGSIDLVYKLQLADIRATVSSVEIPYVMESWSISQKIRGVDVQIKL